MTARQGLDEVLRLAVPTAIGLLGYATMQAIDVALLGRYSTTAQAGAGLTSVLVWTMMCPVLGTMTAIATFAARYAAGGRYRRAGRHLRAALFVGVAVSLLYVAFAAFAPAVIRACYGTRPMDVAGGAYMQIRLLGVPFVVVTMAVSSFYRGIGDAMTPLWISAAANAINVGLDWLLIFGHFGAPELGVRGAALATVIAQAVEASAFAWVLARPGVRGRFAIGLRGRVQLREVRRLLVIGGPIGLYWVTEAGAWAAFFRILRGFGDPAVVAANHAVFQVFHFSFLPVVGLLIATQTLVARYAAKGDPATARARAYLAMRLGIATMATSGVAMFVLREPLMRLFTDDPAVVAVGASMLVWLAFVQPFDAAAMTAIGALRGAGDTLFCWIAVGVLGWCVFLPLAWALAFPLGGGPAAGWIAAIVFLALLAAVTQARFRSGAWERRRV